ncbi:MAG: patatin-like phospholipase family protein [Caulobacteraceae bacterium]
MTQTLRNRPLPSLARFFERQLAEGEAVSFCLPGGSPLFKAGETADHLYFLKTGRLAARIGEAHQRLVTVHPGETVGEMAVIAGAAYPASMFALRDSELFAMPRAAFLAQTHCDADFLVELSRLVLARSRETPSDEPAISRSVFAIVALTPGAKAHLLADQLNTALRKLGHTCVALASDAGPATPQWFANIERNNDFVFYSVEHDQAAWRALVRRQVDGVIHLASGGEAPAKHHRPPAGAPWSMATDLVLLQDPDISAPRGSAAWTEALSPARLFQVRLGRQEDIDRLARNLAGRAVGLVLSGGAARAYAHVGAIQVLRESGAPIDFIGGVSMGAIVGAGIAMGWDDTELDARVRKAFVETSPVGDVTWPVVAITRGGRVRERLAEHFGERAICDLWLPFFCVSTNLTTGGQQIHRQGSLSEALRASLSLPGLLPPVASGDDVLVDGAVLNNFPADIMRSFHGGPIIGVDVGAGRGLTASDIAGPASIAHWFSSGAWRSGAPIVSILIRAATVTAYHQIAAAHEATDVLIEPKLDDVEMGNWKGYDLAVERGRMAAAQALAALEHPITELRHLAGGAE